MVRGPSAEPDENIRRQCHQLQGIFAQGIGIPAGHAFVDTDVAAIDPAQSLRLLQHWVDAESGLRVVEA